MPVARPDVAIVSHNTDDYLLNLLTSLEPFAAAERIGNVHVWDNASTDRTTQVLDRFEHSHPWLHTHRSSRNVHHGPALDHLLRDACQSEWVLVLDSDTEVVRDFSADLRAAVAGEAAFVGQIHPQMPQLYAYLAHLLVHRLQYLDLPGFRHDGAPGVDYFRAIQDEQRPFVPFRWCDYVHHFGQGTLRRIVERGDRSNEFFAFGEHEQSRRPKSPERIAREQQLQTALDAFTTRSPAVSTNGRGARALQAPRAYGSRAASRAPWATVREYLQSPRRAHAWMDAQRLGIVQVRAEALCLLRLVERSRPRTVLEIGTLHGGSLLLWARAAASDATLISVDRPPWEVDDPAERAKRAAIERVGSRHQRVRTLRGDSHDPALQQQARLLLDATAVDFLFLDGDHSYDGVARDFHDYVDLVRPGGMVALHDIQPHSRGWGGDVPRFWQAIRERYRHVEIIASATQDGYGIGVLWV
jgi:predicted O-methyltransferase YrrM